MIKEILLEWLFPPDTAADFGTKTEQMNAFYMNNETDMCKLNGFASSDIQR